MALLSPNILVSVGVFTIVWTVWCLATLIVNVSRARATGLHYVIVPCSMLGAPWLLTQPMLLPFLKALPEWWTEKWLPLLLFNEGWHNGYEPFRRVGADTFLAVSPSDMILYTSDAAVASQLFQNSRLGKPAHLMGLLNIFGPTLTAADGAEARLYRRTVAPFFTEGTMRDVFVGAVQGGTELLQALRQPAAYRQLRTLSAKLSLHLLSRFCNQAETQEDLVNILQCKDKPQGTHRMTYSEAVFTLLENYTTVFLCPHALLRMSPFKTHRQAATAFAEMHRYMEEMKEKKVAELHQKPPTSSNNSSSILELLVQAGLPAADGSPAVLRQDQVIGNIWNFVFAGHETNANTLTFIILLLACHPITQRTMQADLDRILQDTPPDQWTYDAHFNPLMNSLVGAVINETLRLFTVLPVIPKYVPPTGPPVSIIIDSQVHPLPPGTVAFVNTSATHRHPQYWPRRESSTDSIASNNRMKRPFAVSDFDPERWIQTTDSAKNKFLNPIPGSFIPFAEGSRACLGYRFALAELCASVAIIFKSLSVSLLTRDEEGDGSSFGGSADTWEAARDRAELALSEGVKFDMSLRVVHSLPVRFEARK
ncbi:cytochrome P450 [Aspergillus pseudotamarii]|uniref:Cytochrome P450 n=1 Tax=Aspergillus pseudotamarii TaxID=132259 RepID=A0A5N6SW26_ASPPS|nr:cytochrome P450 [Aspergillus pseudotamarii]KAE8137314.1 cytochrome P450 [Aspergillus pseudotamarii]